YESAASAAASASQKWSIAQQASADMGAAVRVNSASFGALLERDESKLGGGQYLTRRIDERLNELTATEGASALNTLRPRHESFITQDGSSYIPASDTQAKMLAIQHYDPEFVGGIYSDATGFNAPGTNSSQFRGVGSAADQVAIQDR